MKNKYLYYHGKTTDNVRFTLCGIYAKYFDSARAHDNRIADDTLLMGIAVCSPKDNFVKKVGRDKSKGRILSNTIYGVSESLVSPGDQNIKNFIEEAKKLEELNVEEVKIIFYLNNK